MGENAFLKVFQERWHFLSLATKSCPRRYAALGRIPRYLRIIIGNRHLKTAPERDLITHDVRDFPGNPN